jgi:uncharacterized protein (TIGR03437 family)
LKSGGKTQAEPPAPPNPIANLQDQRGTQRAIPWPVPGFCGVWVRLMVAVLGSVAYLQSATLSGTGAIAHPGDSVLVSLLFSSGGQAVSGLQFDLAWDPVLNVHLVPGAQVGTAGKVVYTGGMPPGVLRCLIVGMDLNRMADGELIRLFITVDSSARAGVAQVTFTNLIATDANGNPVSLGAPPIGMQIESGSATQPIPASGILNAASSGAGPISPGEILTMFGAISDGALLVFVNGVPAPVIYAGLNQVNAIVPFGLVSGNAAQLEVRQGSTSAKVSVPTAAASPSMFTLNAMGTGPGAILNQDYSVNSFLNGAAPGSVVMVYGTGFGALSPLPADGQPVPVVATTLLPVTATIDGVPAEVLYAGAAPGLIAGVVQINVHVPEELSHNPVAAIALQMGSFTTQSGVTLAIQ